MKKIILLGIFAIVVQSMFAWNWPQCRNYNGSTPEQPATIYLGDNGTFGHDSWDLLDTKWPKWCVVISTNADLTSGALTGAWSSYSNVQHKTNTSPRFTSTGTWYWGMKVEYTDASGTTGWYCNNNASWANMYGSPTSNLTISVTALSDPTSQTATAASSSQINLSWGLWNSKNVMVVRRLTSAAASTAPTQGTPYTVSNTLGTGTVVYNSGGTSFNDTGLTPGTGYTYIFYSENYSYYSAGATANATTNVDITFNANSGTGSMSNQSVPYNTSTALKANSFTKTSYTFNGWNTAANGSGTSYANSASVTLTASTTLYAQWLVDATPILSAGTLTSFGTACTSTTTAANSFTITGTNLTSAVVTVGALSGFTYSTSVDGTYTASLSLTQPGGSYSQAIYVKFSPSAVQSYNGNIAVGGGAASSINVAAVGSGINTAPTVTTPSSASIAATTATLGGNMTVVGCNNSTEQGIYYSTSTGFADGAGTKVSTTGLNVSSIGVFTQAVTGLTAGTVYYYKAFTTSTSGTAYSAQGTFTTLNDISSSDFRSAAAGPANWNTAASWQYNSIGSTWITAPQAPSATNNVIIQSGHTITLDVNATITGAKTITVNGTLDAGTNTVSGTGTFTLAAAGTLKIGSVDGISASGSTGNVQTSTRNFNAAGNYTYNGTSSQVTGDGLPLTITGTLNISNTAANTVTLTTNSSTTSALSMAGGVFVPGSGNTLNIASGGTVSASGGSLASNATGGTINFAGSGTISGTIGFYNVNIAGGVIFGAASTINGTLTINSGGYVNTSAPTYASGSTLKYNTTGTYGRGTEWSATSGAGYPHHVQISNSTTVDMGNAGTDVPRQCAGNLTVDLGSTFSMNTTAMTAAVTIMGDVFNNGTVTLSGSIGGDIKTQGDITRTGTFNANSRAIFFNGGNVQEIQGTGTFNIPYVRINKTGGSVKLVDPLESLAPNGGNAIEIDGAASELDLNGHALSTKSIVLMNSGKLTCGSSTITIAASGWITNGGTFTAGTGTVAFAGAATVTGAVAFNYVTLPSSATVDLGSSSVAQPITGSSTASMSITGTGATGTINFDQTTPGTTNVLQNFTLNRPSGSTTLGGDLVVTNALTLTDGILDLNGKILTLGTSSSITSTSGTIKGGGNSSLSVTGTDALGTLKFDQTTPGTTNVIKDLTINRTSSGTATIGSDLVIGNTLQLTAGTVTSSTGTKLTLLEGSKATTESGTSLTVVDLVFSKGATTTSQFENKGGTVSVGKIKVKVHFPSDAHWQFVSFPFAISAIIKADGTTAAVSGTDYGAVYYDAAKRATGVSGWTALAALAMPTAGTGYAFWGANATSTPTDLYFETAATPSTTSFSTTTTKALTYPSGSTASNNGWNFFAHPLTANANGKLADLGEFRYGYNYLTDTYNVSTSITTSEQQSFDAYFVKTTAARTMNFSTVSMPTSVKSSVTTTIDKLTMNLVGTATNYSTLVRVIPQSTIAYDELYDAPYSGGMLPTTPQIYTLIGGLKFAINSVPEQTTVPIGIRVPATGSYSFTWDAQLTNLPVTLYDNVEKTSTELTAASTYGFTTAVSGEINNRFSIIVAQKITTRLDNGSTENPLYVTNQMGGVRLDGLTGTSTVKLYDMVGKLMQTKVVSTSTMTLNVPVAGLYLLEVNNKIMKLMVK